MGTATLLMLIQGLTTWLEVHYTSPYIYEWKNEKVQQVAESAGPEAQNPVINLNA